MTYMKIIFLYSEQPNASYLQTTITQKRGYS